MKVKLRRALVSDAKRYYEILNHPEFHYWRAKPASIEAEKTYLRGVKDRMEKGTEYTFAVIADGRHVGSVGFTMNPLHPYKCEAGYFIEHKYWGKGIATKALKLVEEYIAENLEVVRIKITMAKGNIGSRQVAIKSGYKKEGLMKKCMKIDGKYHDSYMYAKIVK